jgi:hypothetical protein
MGYAKRTKPRSRMRQSGVPYSLLFQSLSDNKLCSSGEMSRTNRSTV